MSADTTCMDDYDPGSLTIEAALDKILASVTPLIETESVPLDRAQGRVLANTIEATLDVPGFRNSAMDGYAIRHADHASTLRWNIIGSSLAGHPYTGDLAVGDCIRITTGAEVPTDADTIIMQENTERDHTELTVSALPKIGSFVRQQGSNIAKGTTVLSAGTQIGAAEAGVLASVGLNAVTVLRKLKVAFFSTGDELVAAGHTPGPGMIHDSNRYMLMGLLQSPNIELTDLGIQRDSLAALRACMQQAATADVVISSGGVSVGEADYVRDVLAEQGEVNLWKIAMKPGRPLTFATLNSGARYFGLPGNPVSGMVTFHQFVLPGLRAMLRQEAPLQWSQMAILTDSLTKMAGRVELQRGILRQRDDQSWEVSTTGSQDSHVLTSMQRANCYIVLDLDSTGADAGSSVTTLPLQNYQIPL